VSQPAFTIGILASRAGVNVETVRYYQRRGLLDEPRRPPGGTRRYDDAHLARLQAIRKAQGMGFTLEEVADLLADHGEAACAHTEALAKQKLADVRRRIAELQALERELSRIASRCENSKDAHCPVLRDFTGSPGEA
jgi:MerR family mercuric resistance operon transcriptional regulator